MKEPSSTKGYTQFEQKLVTKRTIKLLVSVGFQKIEGQRNWLKTSYAESYAKSIREGDKRKLVVTPPNLFHESWSFVITSEAEPIMIGMAGSTSFGSQWATPEKVFDTIMRKLFEEGYSDARKVARDGAARVCEEIKKQLSSLI